MSTTGTISVHGNVTPRERQIIEAILGVHMAAMFAALGPQQAASGFGPKHTLAALVAAKAFGEKAFPDLEFRIE